jgi:flagellar motor switch protein FliG
MATDVLVRIASLDEMSPEVLGEIENELRLALSPYLRSRKSREHGAARVGAILQSLPQSSRGQVESALARRDRGLVEEQPKLTATPRLRIAPETIDGEFPPPRATAKAQYIPSLSPPPFTELASLTDTDWQQLLQSADESLILLAFAGAEPRLINRVLRSFPRKEADYWRKQFANPGPVKVREIDAAQEELARLAAELTDQGILHWTARQRFAAVA